MEEYRPFIVDRAKGCTLYDIHGTAYLDGVSSLWCNVHGHRHPRLDAAIREQLDRVAHTTNLGMSNTTSIRLAKRLCEIAPHGLEHVFFSSDGSCAVEIAIKMSLQYWRQRKKPQPNKTRYAALEIAYHGDTLGSVSVGGVARFHAMFQPLLFDVMRLPSPAMIPDGVSIEAWLKTIEQILSEHHQQLAAVVIEPLIQGAAGMLTHPAGCLAGLRRLTKKYSVLLIVDEVATGFGRTGKMFACEHEDVEPDFLCVAKGITGGYLPMAATLTTSEIWQAFLGEYAESKTFFHGHTYGGNPLAAAVALASLDVFEEERVLENLQPKIQRLNEHLDRIAQLPHVGRIRRCGFMAGIPLVQNKATDQAFPAAEKLGFAVCEHAKQQGVWLRPLGDTIVIMPPLAVTLAELDQICEAVEVGIVQRTPA
jgi:adenosylmethionine-8-amino-7-oxononanoate aminotransferase